MLIWASKTAPNSPYSVLLLPPNRPSDIMDINSFPRSETDLAINIRKATSIGQSWHYDDLELELELEVD